MSAMPDGSDEGSAGAGIGGDGEGGGGDGPATMDPDGGSAGAPPIDPNLRRLPGAGIGQPYAVNLNDFADLGEPATWAIAADALPSGFSLSEAGVLSGTGEHAEDFVLRAAATFAQQSREREFLLNVFEKHWVSIDRNVRYSVSSDEMSFALANVRTSPVRELALAGKGAQIALPPGDYHQVHSGWFTRDGQFVLFDCADASGGAERCLLDVHGPLPDVVQSSQLELRVPGNGRIGDSWQLPRSSPGQRFVWLPGDARMDVLDLAKVPVEHITLAVAGKVRGSDVPFTSPTFFGDRGVAWLTGEPGGLARELYVLEHGPDGFGPPIHVDVKSEEGGSPKHIVGASQDVLLYRTTTRAFYALDIATRTPRALPFSVRSLSPDGRIVAVSGPTALDAEPGPDQDFLAFYPLDRLGDPEAELVRVPHVRNNQIDPVRWSPSSDGALVSDEAWRPVLLDLRANQLHQLDATELMVDEFSPDGQWLLRRAYDTQHTQILELNADGPRTFEIVAPGAEPHTIRFSPDSSTLALLTERTAEHPGKAWLSQLPNGPARPLDVEAIWPEGIGWLWSDLLLVEGAGNYTKFVISPEPGSTPRPFLEHSHPGREHEENRWSSQP